MKRSERAWHERPICAGIGGAQRVLKAASRKRCDPGTGSST